MRYSPSRANSMAAAASPKDSRPSMPRRAMILARPGTSPVRRSSSLAETSSPEVIVPPSVNFASSPVRSAPPSRARNVSAVARRSRWVRISSSRPSSLTSNSTLPRSVLTMAGRSQIRATGGSSCCSAASADRRTAAAAAAAVRRSALAAEQHDEPPVARICDLPAIVSTLRGKVEFEVSEEGREEEILTHLLRRATADTFRARLGGADLTGLLAKFTDGGTITSGELVSASELLRRTGEVPGLARIMVRLGMEGRESFGDAAAAIEFALEGLYLMRRLSKDAADGTAVYRT